ncbi:LA_0442/LA_0875 N-terminal domain-containing protein [Leptospira yasudae]|uniref:Uncharacterized protein n=1 Tax=Leptospira yasudae TaxID=2202201 RepID=A0A6N4QQ82_9LEPT|nr:hypothetical protein [Leptospira yasudae]TGL74448.1 hypothetical protein EHQ72_17865 [Leptospira yasudae]TGL80576.1 hypothetical protein EHQ77_07610 [Leptospira yasudae]TGL84314.1 hypothetical protein EHQ83_11540 [Leptospira yasudae]
MKKIISYLIIIILLFSFSLQSETLLLKSGQKMEGHIVSQDKESVTFKLDDGTVKVLPKSTIRKISFAKIPDATTKKEPQVNEEEKKAKEAAELAEKQKKEAAELAEKQKAESEKQKAKEEKTKKRELELSASKRHYLEASFGAGSGKEQTELRPFYQTISYAGLLFSSSGQAEILMDPFTTTNKSSTTRLKYAWNRFTVELRGTEAKGNIDVTGFQTLSFGTGGGSSSSGERTANLLVGDANTKFQKVSSRFGFTPYPHPVLDLQILGGVERIWSKTSQEVDSFGQTTASGINPSRISFREYSQAQKGISYGIGFEFKFFERYTFQGQLLHLSMSSPSHLQNYEYRTDPSSSSSSAPRLNQTGLDYWWKSTGTEVNLKLSARIVGNFSLFAEASNMTLKNKLQTGYITDNEGGGDQIGLKIFGPRILIPMLYDSKTILTYFQIGGNYRFDF